MLKINLLPQDRRKKGFPVHKLLLFMTYIVLGFTLICWAISLALFKVTEGKVAGVQDQLGKMSLWQQRYDLNQAQNAEIKRRSDVVNNLLKTRVSWSDNLAQLGNVTPYGVWLTKVNQDSRKPQDLSIEGNALKLDQVLAFVNNLQQDPQNSSVVLEGTTNKAGRQGVSTVSFKLKVTKRGGVTNAKKPQP